MSGRKVARIILVIVFVCLLAMPLLMRRIAARRERVNNSVDASVALSRYGFHLEEVAKTSGINFTHQAPTLDHRLDHIMPEVASMGEGVGRVIKRPAEKTAGACRARAPRRGSRLRGSQPARHRRFDGFGLGR